MFTTLEEAIGEMKARFEPAGRDLAAWPQSPGASEEEVHAVESELGARLPPIFRRTVLRYDFLNAVAGNVSMTHADSLEEWLLRHNVPALCREQDAQWWKGPRRPPNLVLIAQADAHSFLLDLENDQIKALWVDDEDESPCLVARDFADFYRGLASVYLAGVGTEGAEAEAVAVEGSVGAATGCLFWRRFAADAA